jgi:hypothetical protein
MSKKVVVRVHGKAATFEIFEVKATFLALAINSTEMINM